MSTSKSNYLNGLESATGPNLSTPAPKSTRVFYSAVVLDFISNPAEYMEKTIDDWPASGLPGLDTSDLSSDEVSTIESGTTQEALSHNASSISNSILVKKLPRN